MHDLLRMPPLEERMKRKLFHLTLAAIVILLALGRFIST